MNHLKHKKWVSPGRKIFSILPMCWCWFPFTYIFNSGLCYFDDLSQLLFVLPASLSVSVTFSFEFDVLNSYPDCFTVSLQRTSLCMCHIHAYRPSFHPSSPSSLRSLINIFQGHRPPLLHVLKSLNSSYLLSITQQLTKQKLGCRRRGRCCPVKTTAGMKTALRYIKRWLFFYFISKLEQVTSLPHRSYRFFLLKTIT